MLKYDLFEHVVKHKIFFIRGINYHIIFLHFFRHIRKSKKRVNFDDKKIDKINFYKSKRLLKLDDIYFNKTLVSKRKNLMVKKLT